MTSYTIGETLVNRSVEEELRESYLRYSMSVIISRALPDVRDGLKPSQRRILFAMKQLNLGPSAKHRKCAKICGDTSGDYHPHGEMVIYPTLVRMAQDWAMRYTLSRFIRHLQLPLKPLKEPLKIYANYTKNK